MKLDLYSALGATLMRFGNDLTTWTEWEPYATSRQWTLAPGEGVRAVHVQYGDDAEEILSLYTDVIYVDTTVPARPDKPRGVRATDGRARFTCTAPLDNPGGARIGGYEYELEAMSDNSVTKGTTRNMNAATHVAGRDSVGHRFRARAFDNAGNRGQWSEWSDPVDAGAAVEIVASPANTTSLAGQFYVSDNDNYDNLWTYPANYYGEEFPDWFHSISYASAKENEDAPLLVTTITGLDTSKTYDVYVRVLGMRIPNYYGGKMRMGVLGGLSPDALQECSNYTCKPAVMAGSPAPDGTPYYSTFEKKIGTVSGVTLLKVYVDDGKPIQRSHYLGVTLRQVTPAKGKRR